MEEQNFEENQEKIATGTRAKMRPGVILPVGLVAVFGLLFAVKAFAPSGDESGPALFGLSDTDIEAISKEVAREGAGIEVAQTAEQQAEVYSKSVVQANAAIAVAIDEASADRDREIQVRVGELLRKAAEQPNAEEYLNGLLTSINDYTKQVPGSLTGLSGDAATQKEVNGITKERLAVLLAMQALRDPAAVKTAMQHDLLRSITLSEEAVMATRVASAERRRSFEMHQRTVEYERQELAREE